MFGGLAYLWKVTEYIQDFVLDSFTLIPKTGKLNLDVEHKM